MTAGTERVSLIEGKLVIYDDLRVTTIFNNYFVNITAGLPIHCKNNLSMYSSLDEVILQIYEPP